METDLEEVSINNFPNIEGPEVAWPQLCGKNTSEAEMAAQWELQGLWLVPYICTSLASPATTH